MVHDKMTPDVHDARVFLPWHRALLAIHDEAMRDKCGYKGPMPYWDWSFDHSSPESSQIWIHFGPQRDGCVFMPILGSLFSSYPKYHCVSRKWVDNLDYPFYSPAHVQLVMNNPDFHSFATDLEAIPHNSMHYLLGGDMEDLGYSVNDPLFFLHHRNIDRIWWKWQKDNPNAAFQYSEDNSVIELLGMSSVIERLDFKKLYEGPPTIAEVLNTTSGGMDGLMCYNYSNSITTRARAAVNAKTKPFKKPNASGISKRDAITGATGGNIRVAASTFSSFKQSTALGEDFLKSIHYSQSRIDAVRKTESLMANFTSWINLQPLKVKRFLESATYSYNGSVRSKTDFEEQEETNFYKNLVSQFLKQGKLQQVLDSGFDI